MADIERVVSSQKPAAHDDLHCLLIDVHGLKLAVPFDYVEGASEIRDLTLSIDSRQDWILGRYGDAYQQTVVVDTGVWVIPSTYNVDDAAYTDIVVLKGRSWALACNSIIESIYIPLSSLNINKDKTHRAWLYATCLEKRCAILDIQQLLDEFGVMIV
ncbi:hypothetical protein D791_04006 [Nitrincola nitratireducens]|uniref:CheW-like domain protein n=2 Tax=Nitrincola TaxID=267849 RepID=W9UWG6_9GAMM|nr:hypothetical protein D791_04006 [Nitrincola nitratireducens]